jgi:hypothetical protein
VTVITGQFSVKIRRGEKPRVAAGLWLIAQRCLPVS